MIHFQIYSVFNSELFHFVIAIPTVHHSESHTLRCVQEVFKKNFWDWLLLSDLCICLMMHLDVLSICNCSEKIQEVFEC